MGKIEVCEHCGSATRDPGMLTYIPTLPGGFFFFLFCLGIVLLHFSSAYLVGLLKLQAGSLSWKYLELVQYALISLYGFFLWNRFKKFHPQINCPVCSGEETRLLSNTGETRRIEDKSE